jgi:hypothetical protein
MYILGSASVSSAADPWRSYSEAIDILYTANYFCLKGARGMLAMKSVVPSAQWHTIRHLHVSTIFFTPKEDYSGHDRFPPENFTRWSDGCKVLQDLSGLHSLRFEIIVRDTEDSAMPAAVDVEALGSILEPLDNIKAPLFECS